MFQAVNFDMRERVDRLGRLLWPAHCLVCGEACIGDSAGPDLCGRCELDLPWNETACPGCALPLPMPALACGACLQRRRRLDAVHAAFVYDFPLDRLLPGLKFHDGLAAGRLLSRLLAQRFASLPQPQALVPIPLHRSRLRERGYDQALELARPLARALQLPLLDTVLHRERATAPQSRLDASARRRNLRGAFAVRDARALPEHVVLFDDVMTTGATLHAAAAALRKAGVRRIEAWVCARVP